MWKLNNENDEDSHKKIQFNRIDPIKIELS